MVGGDAVGQATRSDLVSPFSCPPGKTAVLEPECRQVSFLGPSLHRGWVGGDQPLAVVSHFSLRTHCVCFKTKTRGMDAFHVCYPKRECVCNRPRQLRALTHVAAGVHQHGLTCTCVPASMGHGPVYLRVAVGRVACVRVLVCPALQRLWGSDFHLLLAAGVFSIGSGFGSSLVFCVYNSWCFQLPLWFVCALMCGRLRVR